MEEEILCQIDVTDEYSGLSRSVYVTTMVDENNEDVDDPCDAFLFAGFHIASPSSMLWMIWTADDGAVWTHGTVH